MAGWFSENSEERKRRLETEAAAEKRAAKKKKDEKRKRQHKEFQNQIDAEVEKYFESNSPEARKARQEQMYGSSSLLNAALGLEFAAKGTRTPTPWMGTPKGILEPKRAENLDKKDGSQNEAKNQAATQMDKTPRLNRPF